MAVTSILTKKLRVITGQQPFALVTCTYVYYQGMLAINPPGEKKAYPRYKVGFYPRVDLNPT